MTKNELLGTLFEKYDLIFDKNNPDSKDNDVFIHKHYKIITRTGIQKIEKKAGIKCDINIVHSGPNYCNVYGKGLTAEGVEYTTLACANENNCTSGYYAEMAEKRCRSRLILTLAGLYEQGVFGEEEAEDFDRNKVRTVAYKGK